MALITPNDGVNDPNSAAVLYVAIYFCRPNNCRPCISQCWQVTAQGELPAVAGRHSFFW